MPREPLEEWHYGTGGLPLQSEGELIAQASPTGILLSLHWLVVEST